jgi:thymidylate kinase
MASLSESYIAEPSNVHRLVIVEGIMGSGKSTTMQVIAKHLQKCGASRLVRSAEGSEDERDR